MGFDIPDEITDLGGANDWRHVMAGCESVYEELPDAGLALAATYAVPMAYRIRFYMQMNAREAIHLIELRTSPQGHPSYRWVGQEMRRRIADAGHRAIAATMQFADMNGGADLERLASERRKEEQAAAVSGESRRT